MGALCLVVLGAGIVTLGTGGVARDPASKAPRAGDTGTAVAVTPTDGPGTSADSADSTDVPSTSASSPATSVATATTATTSTTAVTATGGTEPPGPPGADPVLLAAGDIASCSSSGDEATAALLNARPTAAVAALGDNVYERGSPAEYAGCYAPTWGASRARTRPAPGNHDYGTSGAAGYFDYFGAAAGDAAKGYYSYDIGSWHLVALNSNCSTVSCAAGGAQERWLRADLAAHPAACTLAYWHHPRFSSGTVHGSSTAVGPLWQALYDGNADLVLAGHEHSYERFGPLDPAGRADPARGIRSFVVGTGGRSSYPIGAPLPGSEVRSTGTEGLLQVTLRPGGYAWQFLPVAGRTFRDSGTGRCH